MTDLCEHCGKELDYFKGDAEKTEYDASICDDCNEMMAGWTFCPCDRCIERRGTMTEDELHAVRVNAISEYWKNKERTLAAERRTGEKR